MPTGEGEGQHLKAGKEQAARTPVPQHAHPAGRYCTLCHGAMLPVPVPVPVRLCRVCLQGGSPRPPFTTLAKCVSARSWDVSAPVPRGRGRGRVKRMV